MTTKRAALYLPPALLAAAVSTATGAQGTSPREEAPGASAEQETRRPPGGPLPHSFGDFAEDNVGRARAPRSAPGTRLARARSRGAGTGTAPAMRRTEAVPAPSTATPSGLASTAYPLLVGTALLWAGNAVAGRWAPGEVSPQVLTCLRWAVACAVLMVVARRRFMAERQVLAPYWLRVLLMGACGYTIYASLFYAAGTYTSAVNLTLFQGAIPVLVILMNVAVRGTPVRLAQGIGVVVTLMGAAVAATHGDWTVLTTLNFNRGDLLMLTACVFYAGYTVGLPARPPVSGLTFFTAMATAAFLTSLPPLAVESAAGHLIWPTAKGWAIVGFVALGPTLAAQLAFMRGVELIGPNRAGLFVNLVPVFGALLAVVLVGEPFGRHDALALLLVLCGIAIAERRAKRLPEPKDGSG